MYSPIYIKIKQCCSPKYDKYTNLLLYFRMFWLLVVTAAIALFVIQVGMRFSVYFEYKSNIDVKVNSVETLPFPAVTLCNQNNYR